MNPNDVASYLANNPEFFEQHAELLATVRLTSPVLGRTISMQERQMELAREKYRALELKLAEFVRLAQENDTTVNRLTSWTQSLLSVRNDADLPQVFTTSMQRIFNLPHVTIRCWDVADAYADTWFSAPVSADVQLFTASLTTPFCGKNMDFEAAGWFNVPAATISSIAMLPLRSEGKVFGLVVLGSDDPERYTSQMATHFLTQMAGISSAALRFMIN